MFNVSLGELLLVLVVMILVIKPEEIPGLLKAYAKFMTKINQLKQEVNQLYQVIPPEESVVNKQVFSYRNQQYSYDELGNIREENFSKSDAQKHLQ